MGCAVYSIGRGAADRAGAAGTEPEQGGREQAGQGHGVSADDDDDNNSNESATTADADATADDATSWRGGELVMPQISAFLSPEDGDFLAWRTNRLLHGVAPLAPSALGQAGGAPPLLRTAFVFFQTEAVHRGCLACSD